MKSNMEKETMDSIYKTREDKQNKINGSRREGIKEIIIHNLKRHGDVPKNLIETVNKENSIDILKRWNRLAVESKNFDEFQEGIGCS